MNVKIQSINFNINENLTSFVSDKVRKLDQFYDSIISSEVYLKLENTAEIDNKVSEIRVFIPGNNDVFVKKKAKSFEEATDLAVEALRKQISKHKDKIKGL